MGLFFQLFGRGKDINLDYESFSQMIINENSKCVILDVRTREEYLQGHIRNSLNIDIYKNDFKTKINSLNKQKTYFVYCKSGYRSNSAVKFMHGLGFEQVYNLKGGINKWKGLIEK